MKALDKKLLRDLAHMKGQAFTIALVVAAGIGAFIAQISTYDSLNWSRQSYYETSRFAQVFADVKRAPKAAERQLVEVPGIADVETTVMFDVTLDIPEVAEPVIGRMIGLADSGQLRLNKLFLRQGRMIESGRGNEVLVSEAFAKARKLKPGDQLAAILNGKREQLRIVGVVLSPEYIFATRGGVLPDDKGFGIFWMDRERLASAFNMEGAFNHAVFRLAPGANEQAVIDALDRLLEPYGAFGAHGREDQISNKILSQEINQQKTMSTVFPTIFLAVAAFLLNVVLSRQVATQRSEIATLKAIGYSDTAIAAHYLKLVLFIVFLGIIMGCLIGALLGYKMTSLYTDFFHFPQLTYRVQPWIPLAASGISLIAALGGALKTMHGIMQLAPAEAMRPPSPTKFKRMLLECLGLANLLSPQSRMIIRNLERRPFRTLLTSFAIACAVAIIVSGTFWGDAIDFLVSVQFNAIERGDAQVVFAEPVNGRAQYEIAHLPGVLFTEAARSIPVRLRAGHLSYRTAVSGLPETAELHRVLDTHQQPVLLPIEGVLLTDRLATRLKVKPGEHIQLEVMEGNRIKRDVLVAGVVNDMFGLSAYMNFDTLNRLLGEGNTISTVSVSLDNSQLNQFNAQIKEIPKVATVTFKTTALQSFRETSAKNILVFTTIVTVFAAAIAIGVVYNSARIALAERAWELASLRVLGFTRHEVSALLLGELGIELLLAIPFGLWLGYLLSLLIVTLTHTETFAIPIIIESKTYAYAALTTLIAGIASALFVRHRIDQLDLVGVLKTRE
ncbi:putative ABC transport system permease protein [Sulfurirhabdus autotrophica]|uniref:Putative ABC transport system permease protein n=1 Tax=Sulfurirhabdus autotrophica TaxID=1706046 RepID=A0A4R3YDX4_9PROT|nr:putative ABC transport system permease protein [Sulfurirhabdus autotrophica]